MSSMPPPPTPFNHRRTGINTQAGHSTSPPCSTNTSPSVPRKMTLSKGATFHVPSSPAKENDPTLSITHLPRRSPTCSQSSLMNYILDKEDLAAQSIRDFEQTWSGARGKQSFAHRRRSDEFGRFVRTVKASSPPTDEGLGTSIGSPSEKGLARSFERALDFEKDSALGTSISSNSVKDEYAHSTNRLILNNSEDEDLFVEDLLQVGDSESSTTLGSRQRGNRTPTSITSISRSAVTQSISPQLPRSSTLHPNLGAYARKTLSKEILNPILQEDRFKVFHPLATSLISKSNKSIKCLRDLERSLIFEPLTLSVTQQLYRTFGEFSIQLVLDTYHHLSESEQRRPADRPYDNGYFLDLVQQVGRLAAQIGSARQARAAEEEEKEEPESDEMAYSLEDEVTLEGGLGETGQIAELVRWKNGKGISLRTNQPYEPQPSIKRQHSSASLDDDVERSMARRKKGVEPKIVELPCSAEDCDKVFNRKCDLAKHEKTHTRPFKCPHKGCRYHDHGLPTEKERDRHINDKHDTNPHFFHCIYCPFKTKRDSNCKQHMEKKHGWQYDRVKGNGKAVRMTPVQTPQTDNMEFSPTTDSPAPTNSGWDGSSVSGSVPGSTMVTPLEGPYPDFNTYPTVPQRYTLFSRQQPHHVRTQSDTSFVQPSLPQHRYSGYQASPISPHMTTPITPAGSVAYSYGQSPYMNFNIDINFEAPPNFNNGLPTPGQNYLQPTSSDPSISDHSPIIHEELEQIMSVQSAPSHNLHNMNFNDNMLPDENFNDFTLFSQGANHTSFPPSTADMSSAAGDMFSDMNQMDFTYHETFNDLINVNEMSN